jgi:tetratricopeptide (TPR) repeat protein
LLATLPLLISCGCDTIALSGQGKALEREKAVQYDEAWTATQKVLKQYFPRVRAEERTGQIVAVSNLTTDMGRKTRQRVVAELVEAGDGWYEVEVRVMNQIETSYADPVSERQSSYKWQTIDFDEILEGRLVEEIYREVHGKDVAVGEAGDKAAPERTPTQAPLSQGATVSQSEPEAVTSRKTARSHLAFVPRKASIKDPFTRALILGDMHFKEGNYEGAEEQFLVAQKRDPTSPAPWLAAGHARFALGDYPGAVKALRSGLAAFGKISSIQMDRREFYGDSDQFYAQLAALEEFTKLHTEDSEAFFLLGYNYYFSGRPSLAKKAFERSLELQPNDPQSKEFLRLLSTEPMI